MGNIASLIINKAGDEINSRLAIGRSIVDQQQTAGWGKAIVEQLASDIRTEFPGISGFSARNVWNMRHFLQPKSISATNGGRNWLDAQSGDPRKCKDDLEREFTCG